MASFGDILNFVFDTVGITNQQDRRNRELNNFSLDDLQVTEVGPQTVKIRVPDTSTDGLIRRRVLNSALGNNGNVPLDARTVETTINFKDKLAFDEQGNTVFDFTDVGGEVFEGSIEALQSLQGQDLLNVIGRSVPNTATSNTFNQNFDIGELENQSSQRLIDTGFNRVNDNITDIQERQAKRIISENEEKKRKDASAATKASETTSPVASNTAQPNLSDLSTDGTGATFSFEQLQGLANVGLLLGTDSSFLSDSRFLGDN